MIERMKASLCVIAAIIGGGVVANAAGPSGGAQVAETGSFRTGTSFKGPLGLIASASIPGTNALVTIDKARELGFRAIEGDIKGNGSTFKLSTRASLAGWQPAV
jgi:hypothetical protein